MDQPTQRMRAAGKRALILSSLYSQTTGQRSSTRLPNAKQFNQPSIRRDIPTASTTQSGRITTIPTQGEQTEETGDILSNIPTWMKLVGVALIAVLVVITFGTTSKPTGQKTSTTTPVGVHINTDHPKPPVYAKAASLIDANTGETLYSSNDTKHLPILSTTKLMTALVAVERGRLDQSITITSKIKNDLGAYLSPDSSLMGIKGGETYTLRELLDGLLLMSGNDAAVVIADAVSGNVPDFVVLMNQRAEALGMHNTHFANPHGLLDPDHWSCAHDMAILGKASLSQPDIHEISATKELQLAATSGHHAYDMINGNQFLWWYPGADGGKPGFDGIKNFNQVISCVRNGRRLIGVALGTRDWWTDMRNMMNWGFDNYQWISPADIVKTQFIPYAADWNYFVGDKKTNTIPTSDGRYYYTGFTVSVPILTYFDQNDGLSHFGFPIGMPQTSNSLTSQKFEHATITCDLHTTQCHT